MAKSKKISLKELSDDELYEKIDGDKLQLKKARFNHAVSLLENPNNLDLLTAIAVILGSHRHYV